MANIIIFGTEAIAQVAKYYFDTDSEHQVVAFTSDRSYITNNSFEGKPVVPFEEIEQFYPPSNFKMFIAISYTQLNQLRASKFHHAKIKGYTLVSYISSKCTYLSEFSCGENCFILENNTIQPFVRIGNNVTLWSGNHIGHHSIIKDHTFITSHVVISGLCVLHSYSFIGVNATITHQVEIAESNIIGAGAVITRNTHVSDVYVAPRSILLDKKSNFIDL